MKIDEEKLYSIKEVVVKNGGIIPMSVSALYEAVRSGKIAAISIGKRRFISGITLKKLVNA